MTRILEVLTVLIVLAAMTAMLWLANGAIYDAKAERLPESIKDIQRKIGAEPDGIWGPRTQAYYDEWYKNESGGYWCRKAGM